MNNRQRRMAQKSHDLAGMQIRSAARDPRQDHGYPLPYDRVHNRYDKLTDKALDEILAQPDPEGA